MPVDHSLSYIPQSTDNTCWAASTAMMMGRSSDMEIVKEMQQQYPDSVWDDGATQLELGQVASFYGMTQKMGVKLADGNKVYGTVPNNISHVERGNKVKFVAKVERSEKDEHFGFFSRPAKAQII